MRRLPGFIHFAGRFIYFLTFRVPMKYILSTICLVAFFLCLAACRHKQVSAASAPLPPPHSRKAVLHLPGNLGFLDLYVPERYDTTLSWYNPSDCIPCGEYWFRFQPKTLPICEIKGWFAKCDIDSTDALSLNISMMMKRDDSLNDTTILVQRKKYRDNQKMIDPDTSYICLDTFVKAYDRNIVAFGTSYQGKKLSFCQINAIVSVDKCPIQIEYKLMTQRPDTIRTSFIPHVLQTLESFKFSKPAY
jgi:hypothetical protein